MRKPTSSDYNEGRDMTKTSWILREGLGYVAVLGVTFVIVILWQLAQAAFGVHP